MPSPKRRPKALVPSHDFPPLSEFLAGCPIALKDWPFASRVLLNNALVRRDRPGMHEAAADFYRQALNVATRSLETAR